MKLVIDRSKWGRGDTSAARLLDRPTGRMCCLGFLGRSCNVSETAMNALYPVADGYPEFGDKAWPEWLFASRDDSNQRRHELGSLNDNVNLSNEEREKRLIWEFAEHGVEVEFVDGPVSP